MEYIFPNYIDINSKHPIAIDFAKKIQPSSQLLELSYAFNNPLPLGNCYWNVEHIVSEHGGSIEFGWLFLLWDNVCIEALHHAVWRSPKNELFEITMHPTRKTDAISLFLPDKNSKITLDKVHCIPNKFYPLNNELTDYIKLYNFKLDIIRSINQSLWLSGYRCEWQRKKALGLMIEQTDLSAEVMKCIQETVHLKEQESILSQLMGGKIKELNKLSKTK